MITADPPIRNGPWRWLKRNLLWHLSEDGHAFICGSIVQGRPQTRELGEGPPGNICQSCQRMAVERLDL